MKGKTKLLAVLLIAVLAVTLTGCGAQKKADRGFELTGTWKSVGARGFGQAQPGALVAFDGSKCNFCSPYDTYALYRNNGKLVLDITSFFFAENLTFEVQVLDADRIRVLYGGSAAAELKRV